jgi:arginine/ornithine transport system substrate-binding protein
MHRRSFATLVFLLAAATSAIAQSPDWPKIRIAVEGAYPPFSEIGPDGQIKGFDIDIANALCAELKAQCTFVQQAFDGMIPALNARKFDAVIASMSITEERKRSVAFTDKYYATPARLVARKGTPLLATPAGMKGKRIGVQRSTTHDRFATDTFKDSEIVRYTGQDQVFLDLQSGRLDAVLCDDVAASYGLLRRPAGKDFAFFGPAFTDPRYFGTGAGVALRKGDTQLQAKLNQAIKDIRANGTYEKIEKQYFDFDVYNAR